MPTTTEPKTVVRPVARKLLVHDDGKCKDGKRFTLLVDGNCPACGFPPDMQSTALVYFCSVHDRPLKTDSSCPKCGVVHDKP